MFIVFPIGRHQSEAFSQSLDYIWLMLKDIENYTGKYIGSLYINYTIPHRDTFSRILLFKGQI